MQNLKTLIVTLAVAAILPAAASATPTGPGGAEGVSNGSVWQGIPLVSDGQPDPIVTTGPAGGPGAPSHTAKVRHARRHRRHH